MNAANHRAGESAGDVPRTNTTFTEAQKQALVHVAREAVKAAAGAPSATIDVSGDFPEASGAFVTLKRGGQLRGCIGTLQCQRPLPEEVRRVAISAAREDPRFSPLTAAELQGLEIEVSVLGPLEPIDPLDPSAFDIGRHGLVAEQDHRRGLLLPQVATEWGWDRDTFLAQTCVKAGLPPDAWRRGATIYRFEGVVFGD
jgi:AmmeMemoRadiSam system protein A